MDINQKSINYLKALSAETVSHANSGHTGSAISGSPILYALFKDHLKFNPKNPKFLGRDRFVMSAGHVSALLYSTLHLFGYDISMDTLKSLEPVVQKLQVTLNTSQNLESKQQLVLLVKVSQMLLVWLLAKQCLHQDSTQKICLLLMATPIAILAMVV